MDRHAAKIGAARSMSCGVCAIIPLAKLFTAEYAGLFDVLLPGLSEHRLPLPLGGSSNHFRTDVLREVGGWDAYNVTEDADLGMRLARFGYQSAVIGSTTYEEAPARLGPWLRQRTRWFKGWMRLRYEMDFIINIKYLMIHRLDVSGAIATLSQQILGQSEVGLEAMRMTNRTLSSYPTPPASILRDNTLCRLHGHGPATASRARSGPSRAAGRTPRPSTARKSPWNACAGRC
jgi:hypothetical protein